MINASEFIKAVRGSDNETDTRQIEFGVITQATPTIELYREADGLDPLGNPGDSMPVTCVSGYAPVVGDRVVIARIGTGWVVLGEEVVNADILTALTITHPDFQNFTGQAVLSVSKASGIVTINGYLQRINTATVAGTTYNLGNIPAGYRPVGSVYFPSVAAPSSTSLIPCRVSANSAGDFFLLTPAVVALNSGITLNMSYATQ